MKESANTLILKGGEPEVRVDSVSFMEARVAMPCKRKGTCVLKRGGRSQQRCFDRRWSGGRWDEGEAQTSLGRRGCSVSPGNSRGRLLPVSLRLAVATVLTDTYPPPLPARRHL